MEWIKRNSINIVLIYLFTMLTLTTVFVVLRAEGVNYFIITGFYVIGVLFYVFYGVILRTRIHKLAFILVMFIIIMPIIITNLENIKSFFTSELVDNMTAIYDGIMSQKATYFKNYIFLLMIIIPIISSVLIYFGDLGLHNFISIFTSIILILIYDTGNEKIVIKILPFLVCLIVINFMYNTFLTTISEYNIGCTKNKLLKAMIYVILISILVTIIAINIPPKGTNGNIKISNIITGKNIHTILNKSIVSEFSIKSSGYSNSSTQLGGDVNIDDTLVMIVSGNKDEYLRGTVKDIYTGMSWNRSSETFKAGKDFEFMTQNRYVKSRGAKLKSIDIQVKSIMSTTLFSPMYTTNLYAKNVYGMYSMDNKTLIGENDIIENYKVNYYDYEAKKSDYSDEKNSRYDKYLELPDTITDETIELVNNITQGETTNYEKINNIKNYLLLNYKYSLDTELVNSIDFVDDFLFKSKKGYCVYFASAMTVMCRIAGINARYVEGFKMPQNSIDGKYYVTNANAHAWCEVLVNQENDLWQIEDATPSIWEQDNNDKSNNDKSNNDNENINKNNKSNILNEDNSNNTHENNNSENIDKTNNSKKNAIKMKIGNFFNRRVIKILSLISFFILLRVLSILIYFNILIKSHNMMKLYKYIVKRLKTIGFRESIGMTEKEMFEELDDENLKINIMKFIDILYENKYGNGNSNFNETELIVKKLEEYIRNKSSLLKYIIKLFFEFNY